MKVTFHEKVETEFKNKSCLDDIQLLKTDLEMYFGSEKSKQPYYLGKDVPFTRPDSIEDEEVHHLHFYVDSVSCPITWNKNKTSDSYIVYTFGFMDEDAHHIIDIIGDNAHESCKNYSLMRDYKAIAKNFREKN